jgi:serine protein kinase
MDGISTRFAYKVLSKVFNYDSEEISANPIHLFHVLETEIKKLQLNVEKQDRYLNYIESILKPNYIEYISNELQRAYVDSYSEFGQNLFERYVLYADHWSQDSDFRDPDTGALLNKEELNKELEKIEKPAGIANPKDFRNEVISFTLRYKASNGGETPRWDKYEKMKDVIEKRIFSKTEDLLPVISFSPKDKRDDAEKHKSFVSRMKELGYTEKQIQLIVDWYVRVQKHR